MKNEEVVKSPKMEIKLPPYLRFCIGAAILLIAASLLTFTIAYFLEIKS